MRLHFKVFYSFLVVIALYSCRSGNSDTGEARIRKIIDTVGFASHDWQIDSLMARLDRERWRRTPGTPWKMVICPHDDYTYVGKLYPEALCNIEAKNLILLGVAHKAAALNIEGRLVFDSFSGWKGPWGVVKISSIREDLLKILGEENSMVSDTLQSVEHSLEALIPYLQYFNRDISIVPVLVPAMSPERMAECGNALAEAIKSVAAKNGWEWGRDFSIVATTDAVHYGSEDWGSNNYAYFGCDSAGNIKARNLENEIVTNCLNGKVMPEKIRLFSKYTLDSADFHKYKWTWCGRYSVPVALYTSYFLEIPGELTGEIIGYSTSITGKHIPVDDIGMGRTAIATDCHWVGYSAVGFR